MAGFRTAAAIAKNWRAILTELDKVKPFSPEAEVLIAGLRQLKREYQAGVDADWKPKTRTTARRPIERRRETDGRSEPYAQPPVSLAASSTSRLQN